MSNVPVNPIVDAYIAGVIDGSVVACKWIRKAMQRHVRDLENGHERELWFDPKAANYVIDFCQTFCIPPNDSHPMRLYPAEQAWLAILYGWKRTDGTRRFRRTLFLVAKKNGKSGVSAALALYHLVADGEQSARVYCAATTMKQARTVFKEAVLMRERHPDLKVAVQQAGNEPVIALHIPSSGSRLSPMARSADTEDGAVVSAAICDEIHRWKSEELWTVLKLGGRTRKQPMMICISTAGASAGGTSVCWNEYEYCCKILDGHVVDDEIMPMLFTLDDDDDYKDEKLWVKSNPALGYLFEIDTIRREFKETEGKPTSLGEFKRFSLNIWSSESENPAIEIDKWDACTRAPLANHPDPRRLRAESLKELAGKECYAALDLAPKNDTSSLVLLFPDQWRVIEYFWCPKDNVAARVKRDHVPYDTWSDQGFITLTPGNLTDVRFIAEQIAEINKQFDLKEIAYDDAWSSELVRMLEESGFPMQKFVAFPQSHIRMNGPCQEFMRKVLRRDFTHDRNPVMRWQMASLRWNTQKATSFIKPSRDRKREKIDGPASLIMALARATAPENIAKPKKSFWVVQSSISPVPMSDLEKQFGIVLE
ncbi:MAG TPA: terminase TerL endonuclease subunit [Terriglobales bacterium]|jgi:phage terminase large subunit-like protein|nr:terminase TerL endonuclease subunit [Terriglobales bacterium]